MTRVQHRLSSSMRLAVLLPLLCFVARAQDAASTMDPNTTTQSSASEFTTNSSVTTETVTESTTMSSSTSNMDTTTVSTGDSGGTADMVNQTTTIPPSPTPSEGDNSSSTTNTSSEVTSPEVTAATTTEASNDTTSASNDTSSPTTPTPTTPTPTTPIPTTPTPATTAPPTTEPTPYASIPAELDVAMHKLQLDIGASNKITSSCNTSVTTDEVHMAFVNVSGFLFVTSTSPGSNMTLYFRSQTLLGDSADTQNETEGALIRLNSTLCLNATSEYVTKTSQAFAQRAKDPCQAEKVCPVGYRCEASGATATCKHLCRDFDCGHGDCHLNLTEPRVATRVCSCREEGMFVYTGEKCDTAVHRPAVVIAIVAGVLGSLCFILLLIVICVCVQRARDNAHKYEMNGHFNEGYTGHSLSKM